MSDFHKKFKSFVLESKDFLKLKDEPQMLHQCPLEENEGAVAATCSAVLGSILDELVLLTSPSSLPSHQDSQPSFVVIREGGEPFRLPSSSPPRPSPLDGSRTQGENMSHNFAGPMARGALRPGRHEKRKERRECRRSRFRVFLVSLGFARVGEVAP